MYMLIVELKNGDNIEKALKILKSKVIKTKQTQSLNKRKEFVKKSVKKRNEVQKAIFREKKKNS